ncbi:unnamed protein product [Mycena citricolor]|uniref:Uncharacterized protein n=1 Tax=Mycena citricolor TaxID=2018698 RepID=A0AAD2JW41_9AGAR|nr:unnamed protein product [Mycena citricolor]
MDASLDLRRSINISHWSGRQCILTIHFWFPTQRFLGYMSQPRTRGHDHTWFARPHDELSLSESKGQGYNLDNRPLPSMGRFQPCLLQVSEGGRLYWTQP